MDILDVSNIYGYFLLFSDLSDEQARKWLGLCKSAKINLERRIKRGCGRQDLDRLCQAAGGLAYCDYLLVSRSSAIGSDEFKVGDISVKNGSGFAARGDSMERKLRDEFTAQVADLLKAESIFMAVGGGSSEEAEESEDA